MKKSCEYFEKIIYSDSIDYFGKDYYIKLLKELLNIYKLEREYLKKEIGELTFENQRLERKI